ncbi:hypothetical protein LCGC14_1416860 [marine sediment metagenome]|uniref:Uncharacterized protein n=1 Tax=marine sediment metagenome TaxID=412755 RepID=A0A0F9JSM5_9ZZZZ
MAELRCLDGTVVQISAEMEVKLRKAFGEPEHVWVHGDVFDTGHSIGMFAETVIYGNIIVNLEHRNRGGTPAIQLPGSKFLFNIKDKL